MKQEAQGRINICIVSDSHRNKAILAIKTQESILNPFDFGISAWLVHAQ